MATAITQKHTRAQVLNIMLVLCMAAIVASMFVMDTERYQEFVISEISEIRDTFDEREWRYLESRAKARHQHWLYDTGLFDWIQRSFLPRNYGYDPVNETFENKWLYQWVNNLQIIVYQAFMRLTVMEHWFFTMLPLVVATLGTGYYQWKIKGYYMGGTNAPVIRLYLKAAWYLSMSFVVYITIPNFLHLHNPYVPPTIIVLLAFVGSRVIANYHKT